MVQGRIHFFQHVPFENPGMICDWMNEKNHITDYTLFFEKKFQIPRIENIDWLIVMGGPMSLHDEEKFPWLKAEKDFIKKCIDANKTVIGICLGSQLIAEVLGAKIFKNAFTEIGIMPVEWTAEAQTNFLFNHFPKNQNVFHWHGETFDLPDKTIHLAKTNACINQAFIFKNNVIGLQFHLEVNDLLMRDMISGSREELVDGQYIQSENEIVSNEFLLNENKNLLNAFLDKLSDQSV
jgi:GMP synthase-like glutamine amidotransferase